MCLLAPSTTGPPPPETPGDDFTAPRFLQPHCPAVLQEAMERISFPALCPTANTGALHKPSSASGPQCLLPLPEILSIGLKWGQGRGQTPHVCFLSPREQSSKLPPYNSKSLHVNQLMIWTGLEPFPTVC